MSSPPPLRRQGTSNTRVEPNDPLPTANDPSEKQPEESKTEHATSMFCIFGIQPCTNSRVGKYHHVAGAVPICCPGPSADILALIGIYIMLIWPWIFFGVVWAKKGIQLNNHFANVITNNPHATTYFITLICSIISMIVSALFSLSIVRFAQELVTHRPPTEPFTLRMLLAFRRQSLMSMEDAKQIGSKNLKTWGHAILLSICVAAFPNLMSSTTSLLTPAPFNRTAALTGTELDFSSTASDCLAFFAAHPISNNCDWQVSHSEILQDTSLMACGYQVYNGMQYTSCLGENQMVDVLEAGRGNVSQKSILKRKMSINSILSRRFLS